MWPGSSNTWYINKYGANPYGDHLDSPGMFFTDQWAKTNFKNQLDYLVARYGYSNNIMAWELINETDWIEDYAALSGRAWHNEMATYLHEIDPNHLVSTSFKNDSFYQANFNVFTLQSIDFVNVHRYGVQNHLTYLPQYQQSAFSLYGKPVLYSEIGLEGNGGAQQLSVDPNNISLHQGLWGGLMGGGAGSGMNWWWDTWIHQGNAYDVYTGAASYAKLIDLSGTSYTTLKSLVGVNVSMTNVDYLGYLVDNRLYAYLFDKSFTYTNPQTSLKQNLTFTIPQISSGSYQIQFYNTQSGVMMSTDNINHLTNGQLTITIPSFSNDIALIIEPLEE
jgi:endo-1,4-beta-mannosidase